MTDLRERLAKRPGIHSDRLDDNWNWLSEMHDRAAFDRDIALDTLAELLRTNRHYTAARIVDGDDMPIVLALRANLEAEEVADTILAALKGETK